MNGQGYSRDDLLGILKADLNITSEAYDVYLDHLLQAACEFIEEEGIVMDKPPMFKDAQLIVMYAAYLYRKRDTDTGMPRMLRWTLNNRLFSQKAGGMT